MRHHHWYLININQKAWGVQELSPEEHQTEQEQILIADHQQAAQTETSELIMYLIISIY